MESFFRKLFADGGGKYSEVNNALNERKKKEAGLNQELHALLRKLENALNRYYGTSGTVVVFDMESKSRIRVPLIHIVADMCDWNDFGVEKSIDLIINFHFDSTVHSENIKAVYRNNLIELKVEKYTCIDLEEFCCIVEAVVTKNLKLANDS